MQVQIHLTLNLPADNARLFQLTELMTPTDTLTTVAPVEPPVLLDAPEPVPPLATEPPKRRPHRAVNPATVAAKAAKPAPAPAQDTGGLADSDDDATQDLNGPLDPEDEETLGLATPSMTAGEALEMGLGKVREIYAKGHKGPVKELQQKLGIAKFTDIPPADGHSFLGLVIKLEEKVGMRV